MLPKQMVVSAGLEPAHGTNLVRLRYKLNGATLHYETVNWCGIWESNPEAFVFETKRYANSLQFRMVLKAGIGPALDEILSFVPLPLGYKSKVAPDRRIELLYEP